MPTVHCGQCGRELDEAPGLAPKDRDPCPTCGSLSRRFDVTLEATVGISGTLGPSVTAQAGAAEGTGAAHDASVRTEAGRAERRQTIATYVVELRWDAPTAPGESTMLSAWVDGDCMAMGLQQGDDFGLLLEIADTPGAGVLPPWGDDAP